MAGSKKQSHDARFRAQLRQLHRRIVRNEAPAFNQLARLLRASLVARLVRRFGRQVDEQMIEDGVDMALMEYCAEPTGFDPSHKLNLANFLAMAAWRNVADSLRSEQRRRARERQVIETEKKFFVELTGQAPNTSVNELATQEMVDCLFDWLPSPIDQEILRLKLQGVRQTRPYAVVLRITDLPLEEQKPLVKRTKDRIMQTLRRKAKNRFGDIEQPT